MDPADDSKSIDREEQQQNSVGGLDALGWQATCTSIRDRHAHLLMSETFADVFFIFHEPNSAIRRIPAHKFVLSIGSSVFEAQFRIDPSSAADGGCSNSNTQEVEVVDVEVGAFEALLTFLYTDDIEAINKDSVTSILYTAKKYGVPNLEAACVSFLENCLDSTNAFMVLSMALLYDEKRLADHCLEKIDEEFQEAMETEYFLGIDNKTLCMVLARNTLRVDELTLFNAAIRWALAACRTQKLAPTPDNQRLVLGSAIHQIRFPLMSQTDFAKHVVSSKLLLDSEVVSVFLYYSNCPEDSMPFSSSYRQLFKPEMVIKRFQRVLRGWIYPGHPDRIKFMVDTPVFILGFGLYGSEQESCHYSVLIEILNSNASKVLASNECSFLSDGSQATFRVMFAEPVEISANTSYVASAKLTGISSHHGSKGQCNIKLERNGRPDINWHFQDVFECNNNYTCVERGQIPEIIFCAKHTL